MIHREFRDFRVIMESRDAFNREHTVLGYGGAIEAGDVIETRYRGTPERWRVRSISHEEGLTCWCATVVPVPVLTIVSNEGSVTAMPAPAPVRAVLPPPYRSPLLG